MTKKRRGGFGRRLKFKIAGGAALMLTGGILFASCGAAINDLVTPDEEPAPEATTAPTPAQDPTEEPESTPAPSDAGGDAQEPAEAPAEEDGDVVDSAEFSFGDPPSSPAREITFTAPEDTPDGYYAYAVFDAVTLSPIEVTEGDHCAVRYDFNYAEGGLGRATGSSEDPLPADINFTLLDNTLEFSSLPQEDEFDPQESPAKQLRINHLSSYDGKLDEDGQGGVKLLECGRSVEVLLPSVSMYGTQTLATAEVVVHEDGTLTVRDSSTDYTTAKMLS